VLQYLLFERGFGPVSIDSRFGPGTENALKKFESDRRCSGCMVDGRIVVVGPEWQILLALPRVAIPPNSP
jgi:hypothetical protein